MRQISEDKIKEKFSFKLSLRFELFYALQNLCSDDAKLHLEWKKKALTDFSGRTLARCFPLAAAGTLWPVVADALTMEPLDLTFEQITARFKRIPLNIFKYEILNGLIHYPDIAQKAVKDGALRDALSKVPKGKQEWLAHVGLYPYDNTSPISQSLDLLLKDTGKFRRLCLDVMTHFWNQSFRQTWENLQLPFQKSLTVNKNLFYSCTLDEFVKQTLLKIEFDTQKGEIRALRGGATIPYSTVRSISIFPSVFNEKRFWTSFHNEQHTDIYIPLFDPSIELQTSQSLSHDSHFDLDPSLIFKALGDTTRYAMMKLIGKSPRTSLELANALSVSKPTISHHLHILRQARLVEETPISGSIQLSIRKQTIEQLSELSVADFFGEINHLSTRRVQK